MSSTVRTSLLSTLLFFSFVCLVQAQEPSAGTLEVVEAKLATGVQDRMPAGEASSFAKDSQVFLWMKLTGGASEEITVTWKSGATSHATTLTIGGSPWRTWASKTVRQAGAWTVSVTDASGAVLKELTFTVE